jgi:hypothetical protein
LAGVAIFATFSARRLPSSPEELGVSPGFSGMPNVGAGAAQRSIGLKSAKEERERWREGKCIFLFLQAAEIYVCEVSCVKKEGETRPSKQTQNDQAKRTETRKKKRKERRRIFLAPFFLLLLLQYPSSSVSLYAHDTPPQSETLVSRPTPLELISLRGLLND